MGKVLHLKKEAVNHPSHYGGEGNPYEVVRVIEAWELGLRSPTAGFNLGNAAKYIGRSGLKDDYLQDLEKSAWYLAREIMKEKERRAKAAGPVTTERRRKPR